ncbi:hypothetical protein BC832DRAFT_246494 [Gaertneriomyces semiglobifer]|nr:hypothetical protein BC832DRAFT_246494 [Gaertneriomyces semiglobifer]
MDFSANWACWLLHRSYMQVAFRHSLHKMLLPELKEQILLSKKLAVQCYGTSMITINLHYTQHIPGDILRFGVPRETASFVYEQLIGKFAMSRNRNTNYRAVGPSILKNFWTERLCEVVIDPQKGCPLAEKLNPLHSLPLSDELTSAVHSLMNVQEEILFVTTFRYKHIDVSAGDLISYSQNGARELLPADD